MKKKSNKHISIDDLAAMTNRGFRGVGGRIQGVETRIRGVETKMERGFAELAAAITKLAKGIDDNFYHVNLRLDRVRDDVSDMPAMRSELQDVRQRLTRLEKRTASSR